MTCAVYLEVGRRRTFAAALHWPGWCRSGKTAEAALEALAAYAPRYAAVTELAEVNFPAAAGADFTVVEQLPGSATTDFGAPDEIPAYDGAPLDRVEADRIARLVEASWTTLDRVAAAAPAQLRKGPRGGGRDRDAVVQHVLGAEASYARQVGVRHRQPDPADHAAVTALRHDLVQVFRQESGGTPRSAKGWPTRYAARRIAWHVLDHAWEIEDRSVH